MPESAIITLKLPVFEVLMKQIWQIKHFTLYKTGKLKPNYFLKVNTARASYINFLP